MQCDPRFTGYADTGGIAIKLRISGILLAISVSIQVTMAYV